MEKLKLDLQCLDIGSQEDLFSSKKWICISPSGINSNHASCNMIDFDLKVDIKNNVDGKNGSNDSDDYNIENTGVLWDLTEHMCSAPTPKANVTPHGSPTGFVYPPVYRNSQLQTNTFLDKIKTGITPEICISKFQDEKDRTTKIKIHFFNISGTSSLYYFCNGHTVKYNTTLEFSYDEYLPIRNHLKVTYHCVSNEDEITDVASKVNGITKEIWVEDSAIDKLKKTINNKMMMYHIH